MPPKSWLVLLFWLQSAFAQSSFFGAAVDFPFFSSFKPSGLPKQPLVHVSKHGRGREKPDRIDIVWVLYSYLLLHHHHHHHDTHNHHHKGLCESLCGLHNPKWNWSERRMQKGRPTLHRSTESGTYSGIVHNLDRLDAPNTFSFFRAMDRRSKCLTPQLRSKPVQTKTTHQSLVFIQYSTLLTPFVLNATNYIFIKS